MQLLQRPLFFETSEINEILQKFDAQSQSDWYFRRTVWSRGFDKKVLMP